MQSSRNPLYFCCKSFSFWLFLNTNGKRHDITIIYTYSLIFYYGLNSFHHKLAKIERIFDAYYYDERRRDSNLFIQTIKDNRFTITRLTRHNCYVAETWKGSRSMMIHRFIHFYYLQSMFFINLKVNELHFIYSTYVSF